MGSLHADPCMVTWNNTSAAAFNRRDASLVGSGSRVQNVELAGVSGLGFKVQGSVFRVYGLGVWG